MFLFPLVAFVQISTMLDELATQFEFFFWCVVFGLGVRLEGEQQSTKLQHSSCLLHGNPSKTDPLMQVVLQWPRLKGRACSTPLREVLGVYGGGEHVSASQLGYAPWTTGRH